MAAQQCIPPAPQSAAEAHRLPTLRLLPAQENSRATDLVKPLRHYAVFLSEDSSDDECQREEGPSSGFTESFFFSTPFEWSPSFFHFPDLSLVRVDELMQALLSMYPVVPRDSGPWDWKATGTLCDLYLDPLQGPLACPACTLAPSQTPALTETLGHSPGSYVHPSRPRCAWAGGCLLLPEGLGGRGQPALSPRRPQPYRTLKESDSAEGDEAESPEQRVRKPVGPVPAPPDRAASIDLLEDVFSNLDMEAPLQPLGQAKSLEDLRAPKDLREQPGTFDYQRLDLGGSERSHGMAVALKLAHPYNKLWSLGQDDMAIPSKPPAASPEKPLALLGNSLALPQRPQNQDSILNPSDKEKVPTPTLGSITIPRPQGRKTPELGIVPPPPVARPAKLQAAGTELGDFSEQLQTDRDRRATLSPALFPGHLPRVVPQDPTELLQPLSPGPGAAGTSSDALLALLDPLSTAWSGSTLPPRHTAPNVATPFTPQFSFPPAGTPTAFPQPPLNPFVPSMPAAPPTLPLVSTPAGPFGAPPASLGPAFASGLLLSSAGFCAPHRSQPNLSALSMPNLFGQMPMGTHTSPLQPLGPPAVAPSRIRTLPLARSSARAAEAKQGMALRPGDPLLLPPRPPQGLEPALQPSAPQQARDPFEDLLRKTKQDVSPSPAPAPAPGSVEQLRKQWETFE
ncbi:DENN domain-containing protein 1A [Plecturocebus cupreus]